MLRDITVDSLLKKYNFIDSSKLSEDKININDELVVENSFDQYVKEFVYFLNEAYYRGYVVSESIFKRLMDIIEYEGYEYQIIKSYINILLESMNDYNMDSINRPYYGEFSITSEEALNFINKYLEVLQSNSITAFDYPHYRQDRGLNEAPFEIIPLKETDNPIDVINNKINRNSLNEFIEISYALYKYDINIYLKALGKYEYPLEGLIFLLDETDYVYSDILVEFVKSFSDLNNLSAYYYTTFGEISAIAETNIARLTEILSLNLLINNVISQIGNNYNFWSIIGKNSKLLSNIMGSYVTEDCPTVFAPYMYYMNYIDDSHKEDNYFYLRNLLMNIDYRIICDNFILFIKEIETKLPHDEVISLFNEWLISLMRIDNREIINRLKEFKKELESYHEELFNNFIKTINERIK